MTTLSVDKRIDVLAEGTATMIRALSEHFETTLSLYNRGHTRVGETLLTHAVNRTPCHIACTDVNTVSTQHIALMCYTLTRGSSCAFHKIFIPSLVSRHVSRLAQHTQHFDISFVHQLRLKVDHVQNTLRRFTKPRSDGFTDPEPRTGYEPNKTVDNPIVTE